LEGRRQSNEVVDFVFPSWGGGQQQEKVFFRCEALDFKSLFVQPLLVRSGIPIS
jgi:hypothetical protein